MKICVLVKEVPDAAVTKRINPSTGRLDRSGEKNLNPYDTHAIEAAMQIREGGAVEVEMPAVISVGDAINEPRYPSLKAIMGAKKKPLDKLATGDAGIDTSKVGGEGSQVECGNFHDPPQKSAGTIIEDEDTNETVEKIVAWLDARKLL